MKFDKPFNILSHAYGGNGAKLNVPIKLFLSEVEDGALTQMDHLAQLPFVFHHVAGMPDMHQGYGMPIGGVMATKGYIVPNAVGVDIGCGMCAIRTSLFVGSLDIAIRKKIMGDIRKLIPVGFKHQKRSQNGMPRYKDTTMVYTNPLPIIDKHYDAAKKQLGTLGGGNHFIEIQEGSDGYIWIMIHSGSRNLGKQVADYYNKIAVEHNEKWLSQVPKNWQLAFLPFHGKIGQMYYHEMNYCCDFALANRKLMIDRVEEAMKNHVDVTFYHHDMINIHHNFAALENHFGENVLVHRKGATRAYKEELGIIPGSQGTASYIVKGKGNIESFKSCSHGAGRLMSRKKAKEKLNLQDEIRKLDEQGIVHGIRNKGDLDEASGAYKNIDEVMEHQMNLISVEVELKPLAVVKG
jgi:tRNA-splicing ligase RtcB